MAEPVLSPKAEPRRRRTPKLDLFRLFANGCVADADVDFSGASELFPALYRLATANFLINARTKLCDLLTSRLVGPARDESAFKLVYFASRAGFPDLPPVEIDLELENVVKLFQSVYTRQRRSGQTAFVYNLSDPDLAFHSADGVVVSRVPDPFQTMFRIPEVEVRRTFSSQAKPILVRLKYSQRASYKHAVLKVGDNLCQDYAIQCLFTLFNSIWSNMPETCFTPKVLQYSVVPLGTVPDWEKKTPLPFGVIEFIDGTESSRTCQWKVDDPAHRANYIASLAGGWLAAYIVGLGDRHQDNMLVHSERGLYPIDFGHVFGRGPLLDANPFAIPTQCIDALSSWPMEHPRGGKNGWDVLINVCQEGFEFLRLEGSLITHVAAVLMDGIAGHVQEDVRQLVQERLMLHLPSNKAADVLSGRIKKDPTAWNTIAKHYFHNKKHANEK